MANTKRAQSTKDTRTRRQPNGPATETPAGGRIVCHLILLLPVIGLGLFVVLPFEVALPPYTVVVGMSALLYFAVWRTLRRSIQTGTEGMLGKEAEVIEELTPQGIVRQGKELWTARGIEPIAKGEKVIILAVDGLVATVRRR